jgi:hypothetical protein
LAKLGPLGAKTAVCKSFEEMKSQHGYSRAEFIAALSALEEVPDVEFYLNIWLEYVHCCSLVSRRLTMPERQQFASVSGRARCSCFFLFPQQTILMQPRHNRTLLSVPGIPSAKGNALELSWSDGS